MDNFTNNHPPKISTISRIICYLNLLGNTKKST